MEVMEVSGVVMEVMEVSGVVMEVNDLSMGISVPFPGITAGINFR
jgi:hypothetical protein